MQHQTDGAVRPRIPECLSDNAANWATSGCPTGDDGVRDGIVIRHAPYDRLRCSPITIHALPALAPQWAFEIQYQDGVIEQASVLAGFTYWPDLLVWGDSTMATAPPGGPSTINGILYQMLFGTYASRFLGHPATKGRRLRQAARSLRSSLSPWTAVINNWCHLDIALLNN